MCALKTSKLNKLQLPNSILWVVIDRKGSFFWLEEAAPSAVPTVLLCRCGSVPAAVWPSAEDWASDSRRYISGLITATVAKQLQQSEPSGSRGALRSDQQRLELVADAQLAPLTFWLRESVCPQQSPVDTAVPVWCNSWFTGVYTRLTSTETHASCVSMRG